MERSTLTRLPVDLVSIILVMYCSPGEWLMLGRVARGVRRVVEDGLHGMVGLRSDGLWCWCWWMAARGVGWVHEVRVRENDDGIKGPEADPASCVARNSYVVDGAINVGFIKNNRVHCYTAGYGERITHHHSRPYGLVMATESSLIRLVLLKGGREWVHNGPSGILSLCLVNPDGDYKLLTTAGKVYHNNELQESRLANYLKGAHLTVGSISSVHVAGYASKTTFLWSLVDDAAIWAIETGIPRLSLTPRALLITTHFRTNIYFIPPHGPPFLLLELANPSESPVAVDDVLMFEREPAKKKYLRLLSTQRVGESRKGPVYRPVYYDVFFSK